MRKLQSKGGRVATSELTTLFFSLVFREKAWLSAFSNMQIRFSAAHVTGNVVQIPRSRAP